MKNSQHYLSVLVVIFSFVFNPPASALNGVALLAGQSNHGGIKVKFTAASGTAVTDSCLTSISGAYSLNLAGGLYSVSYSSAGYKTILLNNGSGSVLTNTVVMSTVTLQPGNAVFVSGNVSGVWTSTNTYYVMGDLSVPLNTTLSIQAGTVVRFMGNYKLTSMGGLYASGTPSNMITFTSDDGLTAWNAIILKNDNSLINFCVVEINAQGVIAEYASPEITNCIVRNTQWGIYSLGGAVTIKNNEVYNYGVLGIYCAGSCTGTITCNYVHHAPEGTGIYVNSESDMLVADNHVEATGTGIMIDNFGKPTIRNNYIHDCNFGINFPPNSPVPPGPEPTIINNCIVNATTCGIFCNNTTGNVKIINNIVSGSWQGIRGFNNITCDHNLLFNCNTNFFSVALPGIGTIVSTNNNGDSIDSYFNLFEDPKFVPSNTPNLQTNSPALNAGNMAFNSSIGVDGQSSCLTGVTTGISKYENASSEILIYPTPSEDKVFLKIDGQGQLNMYDAIGQLVLSKPVFLGINEIDIHHLKNGIFYVRVKTSKVDYFGKIAKI